jgi:hypothetical protein
MAFRNEAQIDVTHSKLLHSKKTHSKLTRVIGRSDETKDKNQYKTPPLYR